MTHNYDITYPCYSHLLSGRFLSWKFPKLFSIPSTQNDYHLSSSTAQVFNSLQQGIKLSYDISMITVSNVVNGMCHRSGATWKHLRGSIGWCRLCFTEDKTVTLLKNSFCLVAAKSHSMTLKTQFSHNS